jgi:hypothetical protein
LVDEQALLDHHAVAVISGEKVKGVVHFYQLAGPTAPVNIGNSIRCNNSNSQKYHMMQL